MGTGFSLVYGPKKIDSTQVGAMHNFLNLANAGRPLFVKAQEDLDKAKAQLVTLVDDKTEAQRILTGMSGKYRYIYDEIINNPTAPNPAIDLLLLKENYGKPDSPTWGKEVGNRRNYIPGGTFFNEQEFWSHVLNGISGGGMIKGFQIALVKDWAEFWYKPHEIELKSKIADKDRLIVLKQTEIDGLQKQLDRAIANEEKVSGQRIKENESTPAYLAAKAAADKIKYDADAKRRNTNTVLILGALSVAAVAAVLILRNRG